MREKGGNTNQISQVADRQQGHVTRAQLLALGLGVEAIKHRVRAGDLIAVHAGVYAVGHVPRHAHARAAAAVLACGDGAALSHAAAAALWDVGRWPAAMEVTAPREHRHPGIRTHRSATLTARDIRVLHGVRVTSPVRTVVDLAVPRAGYSDARLIRIVNDLRAAGRLGPSAFAELTARCARVDRLLGNGNGSGNGNGNGNGSTLTRSHLEDRFRAFVTRHGLPMPEINADLDGREVDALYRDQRLIIELDSWQFHQDRATFERDRAKDAAALAAGHVTVRITDARLRRGGATEAAQIRTILAQRNPPDPTEPGPDPGPG